MHEFLQQLVNGVSVGGIYALISTGYALIYSLLGFSNWAHGDVGMLGAYIGLFGVASLHLPFWIAAILAVAGAGLISLANERFAYRRIRANGAPTMFLMIAAMGLSVAFQNAIVTFVGPSFRMYPPVLPVQALSFFGAHVGVLDLISFVLSMVVVAVLAILINKTKFGLAVRAASVDMQTAAFMGVDVDRYIGLVFLLAGGLAGAAGVLLGLKYTIYAQMGNVSLKAFIASVFGGLGSVPGAIVGAFILGIAETMIAGYISPGLRDVFTFVLLIAILVIRPSGLMGRSVEEKA